MSLFDDEVLEFIEDHEGMSFLAKQARTLYEDKDYERLKRFMADVRGAESQEHFFGHNLIEANDVY